ncbi:SCO family protein [Sphingomonas sp. RHCKR47]|uniref:SCO family protein n=1 Tax=Sphingomonas citricola TaxID=2862498 RepID=UPI001C6771C6|nr:SCO family protein [Sphingomonas citricola]MBW6524260.1 SCO family protein [Sphingomonas citricola]
MYMPRMMLAPAALLAAALSACSSAPEQQSVAAPPLAGARIGGPFALIDQNNRATTDRDFAGRYRIMYFGYTFCPDICPTDVQNIGAAMRLLEKSDPALAGRVVPIFVSIDPARDTPAVLKQFVSAFHPRLVGLTGNPQEIARVAKKYGIFFARGKGNADGYLMEHSRQIYLMDPAGKPLALLPETPPQAMADEITKWAK